jgi:hypothetical protein
MKSEKSVFLALGGTEMRWLQYRMLAPRHDSRSDAPGRYSNSNRSYRTGSNSHESCRCSECTLVPVFMQHHSNRVASIEEAGAITAAAALTISCVTAAAAGASMTASIVRTVISDANVMLHSMPLQVASG